MAIRPLAKVSIWPVDSLEQTSLKLTNYTTSEPTRYQIPYPPRLLTFARVHHHHVDRKPRRVQGLVGEDAGAHLRRGSLGTGQVRRGASEKGQTHRGSQK